MKATLNSLHCISTLILVLGAVPTVAVADVYETPFVHEYVNGGYYSAAVYDRDAPSERDVAAAPAAEAMPAENRPRSEPYDGTQYRNGGYFGPQNNDESADTPC